MEYLPEELLLPIFETFDVKTLKALKLQCRRFLSLVDKILFYRGYSNCCDPVNIILRFNANICWVTIDGTNEQFKDGKCFDIHRNRVTYVNGQEPDITFFTGESLNYFIYTVLRTAPQTELEITLEDADSEWIKCYDIIPRKSRVNFILCDFNSPVDVSWMKHNLRVSKCDGIQLDDAFFRDAGSGDLSLKLLPHQNVTEAQFLTVMERKDIFEFKLEQAVMISEETIIQAAEKLLNRSGDVDVTLCVENAPPGTRKSWNYDIIKEGIMRFTNICDEDPIEGKSVATWHNKGDRSVSMTYYIAQNLEPPSKRPRVGANNDCVCIRMRTFDVKKWEII